MNQRYLSFLLLPLITLAVAGCGNSSGNDKAAITKFLDDAKPQTTIINNGFTAESNLVTQMALKKISYSDFKKTYDAQEATLKQEVQAVSQIQVASGAKNYRDEYVNLLNQGVGLMQDQENAMRQDGSMDPAKASKIKDELNTFVSKFKDLSAKYGV